MSAVTSLLNAISPGDPETSPQRLLLLSNELFKLKSEHLTGSPLVSPICLVAMGGPITPKLAPDSEKKTRTGRLSPPTSAKSGEIIVCRGRISRFR
jgi:hypothetical protein